MASKPKSILIVAGHAIWYKKKGQDVHDWHGIEASKFPDPDAMKRTIAQHVEEGCGLVREGLYDAIAFSGGQSRKDIYKENTAISEAQGMKDFAKAEGYNLPKHVILDTYARDSFENVFFSLLAFHDHYDAWPTKLGLLSMPHKSIRFMIMAMGLKIAEFTFHGVGKVDPLEKNCVNEMNNLTKVIHTQAEHVADPLLRAPYFAKKRLGRTPPHYNTSGTEKELKCRDDEYLNCVGSKYCNQDLTNQVASCDSHGGWTELTWPWTL